MRLATVVLVAALVASSGALVPGARSVHRPSRTTRVGRSTTVKAAFWDKPKKERAQLPPGKPSPAERESLFDALFDEPGVQPDGRPEPSTDVPSHLTLELDEDGEPDLARFTYVDEDTCIGCMNCVFVARNTFFMEDSLRGRARVYHQGGDSEDTIDVAIDTCPVNCIHYVSHEDLVTLEQERLQREDSVDFNNYASFKKAWTGQDAAIPETQAKYYGSLAQGT